MDSLPNQIKTLLTTTLFILSLSSGFVYGKASYGVLYVQEIKSVYDGDTFRANVAKVHPLLGSNIGIRINGVDTPEMKDKRPKIKALAKKARLVTYDMLYRAEVVELRNIQRGKYFRIVADVYCDGVSIGSVLIQKGLAKPYYGGKKDKW